MSIETIQVGGRVGKSHQNHGEFAPNTRSKYASCQPASRRLFFAPTVLALHCHRMNFHPLRGGQPVALHAPLDREFKQLLETLDLLDRVH